MPVFRQSQSDADDSAYTYTFLRSVACLLSVTLNRSTDLGSLDTIWQVPKLWGSIAHRGSWGKFEWNRETWHRETIEFVGTNIASLAISNPAICYRNVGSRDFHPCELVSRCQVSRFQRSLLNLSQSMQLQISDATWWIERSCVAWWQGFCFLP